MGAHVDTIVRLGKTSVGYAERLCEDIPGERFARLIAGASGPVQSNHPAFVIGHLSLYPRMLMEGLGVDPAPTEAPAGYQDLFAAGAECRDDPRGTLYPAKSELVECFSRAHGAALDEIAKLDDEALTGPNPREGRSREMFPTLGGALAFMLGSHVMIHLGQISTWRRCEGLGPVM